MSKQDESDFKKFNNKKNYIKKNDIDTKRNKIHSTFYLENSNKKLSCDLQIKIREKDL